MQTDTDTFPCPVCATEMQAQLIWPLVMRGEALEEIPATYFITYVVACPECLGCIPTPASVTVCLN